MNVDEIATDALEIRDDAARQQFLDDKCGDNGDLRARVETLLRALEQTEDDSFLKGAFFGDASTGTARSGSAENLDDRFEIQSTHAIGGLGEVCVAWDRQLKRTVALKRIRPEWSSDQDAAARFRREAEITGYLEHPGVVPIYALGDQSDGRPYYVMQFIRGRTLDDVVAEHWNSDTPRDEEGTARTDWYDSGTLRRLLDHFVDICQTIDYAHSNEIVHRDLKPTNMMVGAYGQTLVVDWGLAKKLGSVDETFSHNPSPDRQQVEADSSVEETRQGTTLGTPSYMSPEQAAGDVSKVGTASDIYCLGATLYFMATGRAPHIGEADLESTLKRIVEGRFQKPRQVCTNIPGQIQAIILKAMAVQPQDRYASAGAMANDVQCFLDDQPLTIYRDPPAERLLRWIRNHRALSASIAVGVLLTLMGSIAGLVVRGEVKRRAQESARRQEIADQEILFQQRSRLLEADASSLAAQQQAESAIVADRFSDAANLLAVALDRIQDHPSLNSQRENLIARQKRLARLGKFSTLSRKGLDLDFLSRDTQAAILLQQSLAELGVWKSKTWWTDMPDQDLSPVQRDRLQRDVYRVLTALKDIYLTRMVSVMGGGFQGRTPSMLKLFRSYLSSNVGVREAEATLEVAKRIESFRPSESTRWIKSIAALRLRKGNRVDVSQLGPPRNPPDGFSLAVYSLIGSQDPAYREWFSGYGDTFMETSDVTAERRYMDVARESLRRVSDDATDDYWIRLTLGQTFYLFAQHADQHGEYDKAVEYYELARSEYGRCLAIRPDAPFGHADRSTVALSQAVLMRDHHNATPGQRRRADELLRTSLRDANEAKRIAPDEHWIYWHVGATAEELGQDDLAAEAFTKATELGFDVQGTLDAPLVRLDGIRGRDQAILFAKARFDDLDQQFKNQNPSESVAPRIVEKARYATLVSALEYSRGKYETALQWAQKSIELNPKYSSAHRLAGWCYLLEGSWTKAGDHFRSAIKLDPKDALSLLGFARLSESEDAGPEWYDLDESDRRYRSAIDHAASKPHQAHAWLGVARNELRRDLLDSSLAAIRSARQLDPACEVTQFLTLGRQQAKDLLRKSKSKHSNLSKEDALLRIAELRGYLDQISAMPIASLRQIVDSASNHPPRELPLLGADFDLPLEQHWRLTLDEVGSSPESTPSSTSPPTRWILNNEVSELHLMRESKGVALRDWHLTQTVPAAVGFRYRLVARVKSTSDSNQSVAFQILDRDRIVMDLPMAPVNTEWTTVTSEFQWGDSVPEESLLTFRPLTLRLRISDPGDERIILDRIQIQLVE